MKWWQHSKCATIAFREPLSHAWRNDRDSFAGANRSVSGLPRKIAFGGFGHHRRHEGHQDADRLDLRTSNRPTEIAQAARQHQVGKEFELVVGKRTNAAIAFQVAVTARFQSTTDLQR